MLAEIKFQKMTTEGKRIRWDLFIIGLILLFYGMVFISFDPFNPIYSSIFCIGLFLFCIGVILLFMFSIAIFGSRFNLFNLVK
jgi:uncharacterized membrane protein HdeD (DUF308 family)